MYRYITINPCAPCARRINFEEELRLPNFSLVELYKQPENLLNEKGQFAVQITEKHPYLKRLVEKCQDLGLTVSGDGTAPVKGGDIRQAQKGDQVTFGTSKRFDVNWVKRDEYFCKKGYRPVYDIVQDWEKIDRAIKQFADQKKSLELNGQNIRFHSRFMVIDGKVVPYEKNQIFVEVPAATLKYILDEVEVVKVKVYRNW